MRLPEEIGPISCQKLVVSVLSPCELEWWVPGEHNEQDDSCREEVNILALILLL